MVDKGWRLLEGYMGVGGGYRGDVGDYWRGGEVEILWGGMKGLVGEEDEVVGGVV